jgi:hypothetical protein
MKECDDLRHEVRSSDDAGSYNMINCLSQGISAETSENAREKHRHVSVGVGDKETDEITKQDARHQNYYYVLDEFTYTSLFKLVIAKLTLYRCAVCLTY